MSNLKQQHLGAIEQTQDEFMKVWHYSPIQAATACEAITIEHMGKFAEWADADGYYQAKVGGIWQNGTDHKIPQEKEFTTSDLIALYFESINQKP